MAVRIESQAEPIPGYKLIERLGGGGFGEVWKAEAPGGLLKAIKFVYGDLHDVGDEGVRAEQELKAMARVKTVRHPYILSLERYDIIDGQLIIVMELADRNLWDRFKECRSQGLPGLPRDELLGYMEEVAEALDLMNNQYQLQHLDIKPQNLFLVHNHVKVADFGLVKDLEGMAASVTGGVTPVYAAPETFDGWVSRFSDQYSLAIVYQELLTGQRPFPGTNVRQLVMQHLQGTPDLAALPAQDRPAIERALAKNPDDRHPTCCTLVELLRAVPRKAPSSKGTPQAGPVLVPTEDLDSDGPATAPNRITPDFSGGTTQWLRSSETPGAAPARDDGLASGAPTEAHGDGVLFPALVIALGSQGLSVLQQLREHIVQQYGSLEPMSQIRLLFLDTDPEVLRTATRGTPGTALTAGEILLAQLNRPSHYLRARDGRAPIETWFNPKMLYRIPRAQVTTGVRALGRLAFCDNYRTITRRLRQELSACLCPDALDSAAKQTQLGLRTNRPRVYVITGLAGGTGGGMFLDLAYVVRAILREMGYEQPELVGLFILPTTDRQRVRAMSLGNTYAALTELHFFANPSELFSARYDERERPVQDAGPAFSRSIVLRLPDQVDSAALRQVASMAGDFLYRDLCSPLGRAVDLARADYPGPPWELRGQFCQTFGLYKFSWPRQAMAQRTAQRLCQILVQRWMSKDAKLIRAPIYNHVQQQWAKHRLGAEHFRAALATGGDRRHSQPFEAVLATFLGELAQVPEPEGRTGAGAPAWSSSQVREAMERLRELLGLPAEDGTANRAGSVSVALESATEGLVTQWGQRLAEVVVKLIEQPEYRLAGAEEAIRQAIACIERVLEEQEKESREQNGRTAEALQRIHALLENPNKNPLGGRRGPASGAEVVEMVRNYARLRYQSLMASRVVSAFLSLRGHLSDELREVNFCRVRLGELLQAFEGTEEGGTRSKDIKGLTACATLTLVPDGAGRLLFPNGCQTLDEAVEQFLSSVGPEDLLDLDTQVQNMIRQQFTALVHVCMTSSNMLKNLELDMIQEARQYVEGRLRVTDVAEMFFAQFPDEEQAKSEIASAFDEAAPEQIVAGKSARSSATRLCLLAVPAGPSAERFRRLARLALPDVELAEAVSPDDIVFYRELPHLPLTDLEQFSAAAREAYRQMISVEHFTPHTRIDITQWHVPGVDRGAGTREQSPAAR